MAHNLNYNRSKGRHAFVSVKETPWHNLGIIVDNAMTSQECIEQALLDYNVDKAPVYVKFNEPISDSRGRLIDDKFCTYRTDTGDSFDIVGKNYEVIQNKEAFNFFDSIVGEGRAIYETAGSLGKGETVFITAKLPNHLRIGNEDVIDQYLLLTMAHDGTGSIIAKFTPIRVVCNNTLSSALSRGKDLIRIKHTANARDRMKEAEILLTATYKTSKETQEIYQHLSQVKVNDKLAEDYFLKLMLTKEELNKLALKGGKWYNSQELSTRKKNVLTELFNYNDNGIGQDMTVCRGTAYGLYNALTGYIQNVKKHGDDEKKFKSIIMNQDADLLQKGLVLIQQLS